MTQYLPIGFSIKNHDLPGEYTIQKVLGRGVSAIAYLTTYTDREGRTSERILKEFYPSNLEISRNGDGSLNCANDNAGKFAEGITRFMAGGDRQNDLRKRTGLTNETSQLLTMFEANNTRYFEVTRSEGMTYDNIEKFTLLERIKLCLATAKLIKRYHEEGLLYLDIKPENIFVLTNSAGEVVTDLIELIDFDSVIEKDKVEFGSSLSFTEAWAAPEQLTPHSYNKISEATDIYAIGELVFWSVFGRHSYVDEHRGFSVYPFDDRPIANSKQTIRRPMKNLLVELFRGTLRSSINNRFSSMQDVVALLTHLAEEAAKKVYIIESEIRPKEFFAGRVEEHKELSNRLKQDRLVFLCGIGGIGKSEIARQYVAANVQNYRNVLYWTYSGDFEKMICLDEYVSISSVSRIEDESDHSYCWRKLRAIKECLSGNNLLIIDNLNSRIEDTQHQEVWEFLLSLPCEILVTTRTKQLQHMLPIREIEDIETLRYIFEYNCPCEEKDTSSVDEIILRLNRHTLLVESIAKQTYASAHTPAEMLVNLEKYGVHGFNKETVGIVKDGHSSRGTIMEHMRNIFSMSLMTIEQQLMLTKLSFLPEWGVTTNDFAAYFRIDNMDIINWLIDYGWAYRGADANKKLSVHPVIAELVFENFKANDVLHKEFYADATKAFSWNPKTLSQSVHAQYSEAIASGTIKCGIETRESAIFLQRYVNRFASYGNSNQKAEQLQYAIKVLEKETNSQKYSAVVEYAYFSYIPYVRTNSTIDQAISLCEDHLIKVKKAKDLYMTARFCMLYSSLLTSKHATRNGGIKGYLVGVFYALIGTFYCAKMNRDMKRNHPKFMSGEMLLSTLDYDYLADERASFSYNFYISYAGYLENINANILFCMKLHRREIKNLETAIGMRRRMRRDRILRPTHNSIEIVVDEARILYLQGKYEEAEGKLNQVVELFTREKRLPTMSLYRVHQFLGNIAATKGDYATAVSELKHCLDISEDLQIQENYLVNVQLGRFLNETGDLEASEELTTRVLSEVEQLDVDARKSYLGDALYNYATLQSLKSDPNTALRTYAKAIQEYGQCNALVEFTHIGRARCCRKMFEIYQAYGKTEAAQAKFKQAEEWYELCLDQNHPEIRAFYSQRPTN